MTQNHLSKAASPYLLQHADNPIHWHQWNKTTLDTAKAKHRPIFLSIGYAACHWCHVMAHECFEDDEVATILNAHFICIKVDREERPDIDQIYMSALVAMGEQGGWPISFFLTPNAEPVWGGTYFPKHPRYGQPGFLNVLDAVTKTFKQKPDHVKANAESLLEYLIRPLGPPTHLDENQINDAAERLYGIMDQENGGTKGAPKFPQFAIHLFFLRNFYRTRNKTYLDITIKTAEKLCTGGIYDHVGGGLARYSTDDKWLVPHFEKMLYDNAQFIELLSYLYLETGNPIFRLRIEETLDWLDREMRLEEGTYAASLDADSEGEEGKYYIWTTRELTELLTDKELRFLKTYYDLTDNGNWEGSTILNLTSQKIISSHQNHNKAQKICRKLLKQRELRPAPARDHKQLTDWNGLLISSMAIAGRVLEKPHLINKAEDIFNKLTDQFNSKGTIFPHSVNRNQSLYPPILSDFAYLINAAVELFLATTKQSYLASAEKLFSKAKEEYFDPQNGYYLASSTANDLILRPLASKDDALPAPAAIMIRNAHRLWQCTGEQEYANHADQTLSLLSGQINENLFTSISLLSAAHDRMADKITIALVSNENQLAETRRELAKNLKIDEVSFVAESNALPDAHPATGKSVLENKPTFYRCEYGKCSLPTHSLE